MLPILLEKNINFISHIDWSPQGNQLLFRTRDNEKNTIWTINTDGSNQQLALEDNRGFMSPRWSPHGNSILYLRGGVLGAELWSVEISPDTGMPEKDPGQVITGLQGILFSCSKDRKKLVYSKVQSYVNLWFTELSQSGESSISEIKPITTGTSVNNYPRISPDGKQIVFTRLDGKKVNLYTMPIECGPPTQITFLNAGILNPVWSPDGTTIAFLSYESGAPRVWKINSQGGNPYQFEGTEFSTTSPQITWAPGSDLLYLRPGNRNFNILNPETGEETPLLKDESLGFTFRPVYSPNGRKIALAWNRFDSGRGLWIISLDDSSSALIKKGMYEPIGWSPDGNWIYTAEIIQDTLKILMIELESGKERVFAEIPIQFELGRPNLPSMSPDAQNFIIPIVKTNSDVWLIENFDEIRK